MGVACQRSVTSDNFAPFGCGLCSRAGHFFYLVLIIFGILIIWNYRGRIKALGLLLAIYSLLCSLLNFLVFQIGIGFESYRQYGFYEAFVWGVDLLQVWGIWWFLRGKEVIDESH